MWCRFKFFSLLRRLECDASLATELFECNYMKINDNKCHLLVGGRQHDQCALMLALLKFGKAKVRSFLGKLLIGF